AEDGHYVDVATRHLRISGKDRRGAFERPRCMPRVERNARRLDEGRQRVTYVSHAGHPPQPRSTKMRRATSPVVDPLSYAPFNRANTEPQPPTARRRSGRHALGAADGHQSVGRHRPSAEHALVAHMPRIDSVAGVLARMLVETDEQRA